MNKSIMDKIEDLAIADSLDFKNSKYVIMDGQTCLELNEELIRLRYFSTSDVISEITTSIGPLKIIPIKSHKRILALSEGTNYTITKYLLKELDGIERAIERIK